MMKINRLIQAIHPRQIKALAAAVIAVLGLTLAIVAFGVTSDHSVLAQQVVDALSHGPVGDAVQFIYMK